MTPVVHIAIGLNSDQALCGEPIRKGWYRDKPIPTGPMPVCEDCRTRYLQEVEEASSHEA